MEATPRFELGSMELQSTALPLGYVATFTYIKKMVVILRDSNAGHPD